jgi:hypothetical protein
MDVKGITRRLLIVLGLVSLLTLVLAPASHAIPGWWVNKVAETGGNGTFQSPSWVVQGTGCTTPSYASMVNGQQGKINSCYITHVDANGVLNQAEVGWLWLGTESRAPMHFSATIRNSDVTHQYVWLINWFTAGSAHHYRIRYVGQGSGEQLWDIWIDYVWTGRIGSTWCAGGWSHIGGERSVAPAVPCGGNAEFTWCEKWNGSGWSAWTTPNDWNTLGAPWWNGQAWVQWGCDSDPSYEFQRVGSVPTQTCRIRPG